MDDISNSEGDTKVKRLIICCDGTWQGLDNDELTNVAKLYQAVRDTDDEGLPQMTYYDAGVGADSTGFEQLMAGAFGWGLDENILQAYRFLCEHYEAGDRICLFGYSRGAYTVRSLAGLVNTAGLLQAQYVGLAEDAYKLYRNKDAGAASPAAAGFREKYSQPVEIAFLGCWDTVGALGIPDILPYFPVDDLFNKAYQFHDTELSGIIRQARHAIALDEKRHTYEVTHMNLSAEARAAGLDLQEMWFIGRHSVVGGGKPDICGLSDISLQWMLDEAAAAGIAFDAPVCAPDPMVDYGIRLQEWFMPVAREFRGGRGNIHPTVFARMAANPAYRPRSIRDFFPDSSNDRLPA